ncbi:hypothetical protein ACWCP6_08260 [Streptomyces sp. NPDC002004]
MPATTRTGSVRRTSSRPAPRPARVKRSRTRRAGESAFGLLLLGQRVAMGGVAALLLIAGVWASWGTAQHVMFTKGRERGTMTVTRCSDNRCTGPYDPASPGSQPRDRVSLDQAVEAVGAHKGEHIAVALKPGTTDAVRTGFSGLLRAWVPLGGGLLLASVVVAGGLRARRTAWALALSGLALVTAAFVTL